MSEKTFDELSFSDDFMFCRVLQGHPDLCKELLELILDRPVGNLITDAQKTIEITPDGHGVRFDVYAKEDETTVFDVEMQNARRDSLPKRARYAQSMIDQELLKKGVPYKELKQGIVIFICRFNLVPEAGLHKYSFRNLCAENPAISLEDGTEKIFLCTEGSAEDISQEMKQFLQFVAGKEQEGGLANRLADAVEEEKQNPLWRKAYMDMKDYLDIAREEGRKAGREEERKNTEHERQRVRKEQERARRAEESVRLLQEKVAQLEAALARQ